MTTDETQSIAPRPPKARWWPASAILTVAAAASVYIWQFQDVHRQTKNLQTALLVLIALVLLLVWALAFSRFTGTRRSVVFAGTVGLACLLAATLRIKGVTGDLLPVLEWRWSQSTSTSLVVEQPPPTSPELRVPIQSDTDYFQISGPSRDSKLPGPRLHRDWQTRPPELMWRQPIGGGWSGFATLGGYAVTMEQRGQNEVVSCYGLLTGDSIWMHADESHFESVIAGEGPRAVPTIVGGRVFTLGASGICNCLDLLDGSVIWSKNIVAESEASIPEWGISGSPLVAEGKVVVSAGGTAGRSLLAYSSETGDLVWSQGDDSAGYSSPVLANIEGVAQTLIFNGPGVKSHDLATGEVLWAYDWPRGHPHIVMPVVLSDGRVLISSGYGTGSELIQVRRDEASQWTTKRIWKSNRLKSKFANVIVHDDYIYGLDDGIFACLDLDGGALQWKRGRYGHGQTILVGDLLLVLAENGELVLLEPAHERHRELTHFAVLDGKTWNPPALAGEYLLVRNDKEAACFRLPTE